MNMKEPFGPQLRQMRIAANLSQGAVAVAAPIPQGSLSEIENGRRDPRRKTVNKILAAIERLREGGR